MAKRKRPQAQSAQSNIRQATAHPLFVQGLALHRQGRLAEADAYYQQV